MSWVDFRDPGIVQLRQILSTSRGNCRTGGLFSLPAVIQNLTITALLFWFLFSFSSSTLDVLRFLYILCLPNWPGTSAANYNLTPSLPSKSFICLLKWREAIKLNCFSPPGHSFTMESSPGRFTALFSVNCEKTGRGKGRERGCQGPLWC